MQWQERQRWAKFAVCGVCVLSSCVVAGSTQQQLLGKCEPPARSVQLVNPPHLDRAHLYLIGSVLLELSLARSGTVDAVQLVRSTLEVRGRSPKVLTVSQFEQDLTAAVRQWRFAPLPRGCTQPVVMKFELTD